MSDAVHSMFGADNAATTDSRISQLAGDLPNHMRIGWSEFDAAAQAPLIRELSRSIFSAGWVRTALQDRIELALATEDRVDDQQHLWSDPGVNPNGPLSLVAARINDDRVLSKVRRAATGNLEDVIAQRQQRPDGLQWLVDHVIPSVTISAGSANNGQQTVDGREFLLTLLDGDDGARTFGAAGFTVNGLSGQGPNVVTRAVSTVGLPVVPPFIGISGASSPTSGSSIATKALVRIDFTRPLEPSDLVFTEPGMTDDGSVDGLGPIVPG